MERPAAPDFSIILPTHHRPDVLPLAIESVLRQSVQNFELFVVGDGCTDNTGQVVTAMGDPRIVWLDLPKALGFGYGNRNVALRQARGEFVAYMTHDDLWMPDHLALLAAALRRPGIELAYTRPLWVLPGGRIAPGNFNLEYPPTMMEFLERRRSEIPSSCVAHRRVCLERDGYWNDKLPIRGDWDLWIRIIEGGPARNLAFVSVPSCLHFRADWRKKGKDIPGHDRIWERLHREAGFMPAELRVAVGSHETDQAAIWSAMTRPTGERPTWSDSVRSAAVQVLDARVGESDLVLRLAATTGFIWRLLRGLLQLIKSARRIRQSQGDA